MTLIGKVSLLGTLGTLADLATDPGLDLRVRRAGLLLEAAIKSRVSGRPGPRVVTGNYRRSWNTQKVIGSDNAYSVGTNAPQGRRLEFGFSAADSLGRVYDQPAFPHVEPAFLEVEDQMVEIIGSRIDDILG